MPAPTRMYLWWSLCTFVFTHIAGESCHRPFTSFLHLYNKFSSSAYWTPFACGQFQLSLLSFKECCDDSKRCCCHRGQFGRMVPWFQMLLPSLTQAGVRQNDVAAVTGSDVVGDRRDASWCKPEWCCSCQTVMLFVMQENQAGVRQNDAAVVADCDVVQNGRDARWCEPEWCCSCCRQWCCKWWKWHRLVRAGTRLRSSQEAVVAGDDAVSDGRDAGWCEPEQCCGHCRRWWWLCRWRTQKGRQWTPRRSAQHTMHWFITTQH